MGCEIRRQHCWFKQTTEGIRKQSQNTTNCLIKLNTLLYIEINTYYCTHLVHVDPSVQRKPAVLLVGVRMPFSTWLRRPRSRRFACPRRFNPTDPPPAPAPFDPRGTGAGFCMSPRGDLWNRWSLRRRSSMLWFFELLLRLVATRSFLAHFST